MLTTKVAWLVVRVACRMGAFKSVWQWTMRLFVRALQFALCLGSIILLSTGFAVGSFQGHDSILATALLAFLGFVYALWWFLLIELLPLSPRPRFVYSALMDLILALCLLAAAIVLLLSEFVRNCLSFGHVLRCANLNGAVITLFLATVSFLLTPWIAYRSSRREAREQERRDDPVPETPRDSYQPAATPVATTDHGNKNTPERRV